MTFRDKRLEVNKLLQHDFLKTNKQSQFIEYLFKLYEKNLKNSSSLNSSLNYKILTDCQSNNYFENDQNLIKTIFTNTFNDEIQILPIEKDLSCQDPNLRKSLKKSIDKTIYEFNNNLDQRYTNINYNSINIISNNFINNIDKIEILLPKILKSLVIGDNN